MALPYCTAAQAIRAYDLKRWQQLLSDSGTPVAAGEVETDDTFEQLLCEASEIVQGAVAVGKRYTSDDLDALAASTTSGFMLRRLVADIAYGLLVARRGQAASDIARLAPRYVIAEQQLDLLRRGERLLGLIDEDDPHPDAGLPALVDLDPAVNANAPQTMLTTLSRRLFPSRFTSFSE